MNLNQYRDAYPQQEIELLEAFLNAVESADSELRLAVIADVPGEIGVEVFHGGEKLAEGYCAEDKTGTLLGELQAYFRGSWDSAVPLSVDAAVACILNTQE